MAQGEKQTREQTSNAAGVQVFDLLKDFERRSLSHSVGLPEQVEVQGQWSGIGFRLGDFWLASTIGEIKEILPFPSLTRVPGSSTWLLGVANVRGTLAAVIDLRGFLEGVETRLTPRSRVLLVLQEGGVVGLLVDEVSGLRRFMDDELANDPVISESYLGPFVEREYEREGTHWGVFNLTGLLRLPEFVQAAA